jgi:hypothetical protein
MAVALLGAAMLVGSATASTNAVAAPAPVKLLLKSSLAPSVPTDPALHGVTAGGAPWVLKPSELHLFSNGDIQVLIRGLVIPGLGTPGPVKSVDAAIYCANETIPAATTPSVALSDEGNALIVARVKLPTTCLTPVVLINPNGIGSIYIATSGFSG